MSHSTGMDDHSQSDAANAILMSSQQQHQSQSQSQPSNSNYDTRMNDLNQTQSQSQVSFDDNLDQFSAQASAPAPVVYLATYSNVPVYELTVRGIGVMRRRVDGFLNATQILKLAGVDKGKRTKILEKEILTGEHEKVQGGYGKYQGTWIPLGRAIELAGTYNVAHLLQPLLELDPNGQIPVAGRRKRPNPNAPAASMYHRQQAEAASSAPSNGDLGETSFGDSASTSRQPPKKPKNPNYTNHHSQAAIAAANLSQGFNDSQSSSSSSMFPSQPSQQPRFLQLKPPTDTAKSSSSNSTGSVQPDASIFLPPGAGKVLVSVDSNHNNGSIPAGTSENQLNNLINYDSFGYSPNGIPLPSSNQIKNLKRSAPSSQQDGGVIDSEGGMDETSGREKRSRGNEQTPESFDQELGIEPSSNNVKDLNSLGPSGGSLRSAIRPRSNVLKINGPDLEAQNLLEGPKFADKPVPVRPTDEGEKRLRNSLVALFAQEDSEFTNEDDEASKGKGKESKLDDLLKDLKESSSLGGGAGVSNNGVTSSNLPNLNLVIDDHGHTSLHWAVALSRLPLISLLVSKPPSQGGSNPNAGNHAGETPLHRSVLVTNSYESSSFPRILDLLKSSLEVRDFRKRTVLHHISLVAGQRGRSNAALYYLNCVLDFLEEQYRKKGEEVGSGIKSKAFKDFINAQDDDGETALGNVSRIGNALMIKLLLKNGARKDLANHFGIKPDDWSFNGDLDGNSTNQNENNAPAGDDLELGINRPVDAVNALIPPPKGPIGKSKDTMEKIQQTLSDLNSIFEKELETKSSSLTLIQSHLQAATKELSSRRRLVNNAQSLITESEENHQRNLSLRKALKKHFDCQIDDDDGMDLQKFRDQLKTKLDLSQAEIESEDGKGGENSTAAFEQSLDQLQASDDGEEIIKNRFLKALLEKICQELNDKIEQVRIEKERKEHNSKRVVAACCNVRMENVEGMLEDLAVAIESDGPDVDIVRVASFLQGKTAS